MLSESKISIIGKSSLQRGKDADAKGGERTEGTHFWVVGLTNDTVYKYNSSGVYQNVSFSVAAQELTPSGIAWDGTHFWVVGLETDAAYKYTSAGVYTGTSFSVVAQENGPSGIAWDGTNFWVIGFTNDTAYKYGDAIGITSDTSFGAQNYVRVA